MEFDDLTPEQQEKARACRTPEDVLALAKESGIELTDEQMQAVSGGWSEVDDCTTKYNDPRYRYFLR